MTDRDIDRAFTHWRAAPLPAVVPGLAVQVIHAARQARAARRQSLMRAAWRAAPAAVSLVFGLTAAALLATPEPDDMMAVFDPQADFLLGPPGPVGGLD
ncbi:hypothetical protein [Maricaulis sp. CAU 1757]